MMLMLYYNHTGQSALKELQTSARGLSNTEAKTRLTTYGPNSIDVAGVPLWRKIIEPFADVFMVVLFAATLISIFQQHWLDAIIIGLVIVVNATIFYLQRYSTERVLRSLRKHEEQKVNVLRNNTLTQIDSTLLVPGDIIMLGEGDKIPADARLIDASNVRVDESLLTGESEPVEKSIEALRGEKQVYERTNLLFQGAFLISGEATAVVTNTGNDTEFGQIAALSRQEDAEGPVQKKINRLIQQIVIAVAVVSVVAFLLALRNGMSVADSLQFVLALAVSAVPEGLPIAISVILVLGMRRMAAKKALVRNMRAIETIGVITTIATDKTGTLTKNKLTAQETWQPATVTRNIAEVIGRAINTGDSSHDPLDTALHDFVKHGAKLPKSRPALSLPFNQLAAMSGNLWHNGDAYDLYVKGAPEKILHHSSLTSEEEETALAALHHLTSQGYRVIAVASTSLEKSIETFDDLPKRTSFDFVGYIAVADVLRPEAKRAVHSALKAGVTVRMITGDHFETAYHIGKSLGMVEHRGQVFDCRQMDVLSDEELENIIEKTRVFSRVIPEHKYRILELMKKHDISAMTGDGVNDVPALSSAHVGIAMGSGSQIAKDAGDMILLDDNFKSIIDAMREGRSIMTNVRRMLFYLLATNTGAVLIMLTALVVGMPLPLAAVQILWVNLVTDTAMVIPLGLGSDEKDSMAKKPLSPRAPILSRFNLVHMILIALTMATLTLFFYITYSASHGHAYASTIAFITLVVMQWANAFNAQSSYESIFSRIRAVNGKLYVGLAIAVSLQALAIFGPLQTMLHVEPVSIGDIMYVSAIAFIAPLLIGEIYKFIGRRMQKHQNTQQFHFEHRGQNAA